MKGPSVLLPRWRAFLDISEARLNSKMWLFDLQPTPQCQLLLWQQVRSRGWLQAVSRLGLEAVLKIFRIGKWRTVSELRSYPSCGREPFMVTEGVIVICRLSS